MALKSVLDNLDGVDDSIKALYVEDGERFVLAIDGIDDHPEVANLKTAYERTKADKAKAISEREAFKEKAGNLPEDFDPQIWESAKSGKADEAATAAKIAEVRAALEGERDAAKLELDGLKAQIQRDAIQKSVMTALAENKVPEGPREAAALAVTNGQKIEVNGSDVIIDTEMGPKTVNDYVKSWVAGPGKWAVPDASGGGAQGGAKGGGASSPKSWGEAKSTKDKVALLKSKQE